MKKSTLALAVAAALTGFGSAAYADTTLYGSARVSVDYDDVESTYRYLGGQVAPGPSRTTVGNEVWDVFNNISRIGVRGEEDLGGGLSAIYNFEFPVDISEGGNFDGSTTRPKWVGLKGTGWGSFTAGTQWTPYYNALGIGDIFNSSKVYSSSTTFGTTANPNLNAFLGNAFGLREDNSLIYTTPNWSGFSAQAMLVMNGTGAATNRTTLLTANDPAATDLSDGIDLWNVGAIYKNGPFFLGASYMALNNSNDTLFYSAAAYPGGFTPLTRQSADDLEQWGLAVGYNAGPFAISLAYEDGDLNTVNTGDSQNIWLAGQYNFGNNVIRAAYGYLTADQDRILGVVPGTSLTQGDQSNFVVGYQYNFSKRTRVWVEYLGRYVDDDRPATGVNFDRYGDSQTVSIGTRVDF